MKPSKDDSIYISRGDWMNVGNLLVLIAKSMALREDTRRIEQMVRRLGAKKPKAAKAKI